MSNELIVSSRTSVSPTPRELAATLFRRPRLVAAAFGAVLAATMLVVVFSARYESHFKVLLRRGRYDPVVSSQPPSPMDFTRPDITEEELNSEVELLRDEDLLKKVVAMAELVPADTPDSERAEEVEHAVRKLSRRRCGGAEEVESDPGSLQGQESGKGCARAVGALDCVCAKAYESAAASGGESVLQSANCRI
jgi:uncharacterized protein involved in exopolysaccharide biosynthesis